MGVTIHHRFGQKKEFVKSTLDEVQNRALDMANNVAESVGIKMSVKRYDDQCLGIDIGGCETLMFDFQPMERWEALKEKDGWNYQHAVLAEDGQKIDRDLYYSAEFCKTQFASSIIEHKWVADLIRIVASRCRFAEVYDEGDYYHSGKIDDAKDSIAENGAMIDSLTGQLGGQGFEVVKGGETKIKGRKNGKMKSNEK